MDLPTPSTHISGVGGHCVSQGLIRGWPEGLGLSSWAHRDTAVSDKAKEVRKEPEERHSLGSWGSGSRLTQLG